MPLNGPEQIPGWNSYAPIFAELIAKTNSRTIIEVGSWQGASACHMASLAPDAAIYCVDTWQGSAEHQSSELPRNESGGSDLFRRFTENINKAGVASRIFPVTATSQDAAKTFGPWIGRADLVYIDGSHAYEDVKADLAAYWPLVRSGGVMFGDDFLEWATVRRAVEEFGTPTVSGNHWYFVKP